MEYDGGDDNDNDNDNGVNIDVVEDDLEPLPTPKVGDNYLSADITLPMGGILTKGCVISRKRDADGNTVGRVKTHVLTMWSSRTAPLMN